MPSLSEIAEEARSIHCRLLTGATGQRTTEGSCFYAAVLLANMLNNFGDGVSAVIRGGDGLGDGGFQDSAGKWHGHYWVEATGPSGVFIVDITADQFWQAPVLVIPIDAAVGYAPGNQQIVNGHVAEHAPAT